MADGVGLSVGATNLAAVVLGRAAVIRTAVVTLYSHRSPEVGLPSENPGLNHRLNPNRTERGVIITDFVDRVGDPVGLIAADGSTHRCEAVLSEALRGMVSVVSRGRAATDPMAVTHPAHWRPSAVGALRRALGAVPEFSCGPRQLTLLSDAAAVLTALQDDPGLPTRGVIALCDFGGSGTSITLADAGNGCQPFGPTIRHRDFSGNLIDEAILTRVIGDLSAAGSVNLLDASAIGSLTRLRRQCRAAKERLSTTAVTALPVELPGFHGDIHFTRNDLDDVVRQPLGVFIDHVQHVLRCSRIRPADLVAVASTGGGAALPAVTMALLEHLRAPVVTPPQPGLTAAIGGGLRAGWDSTDDRPVAPAAAAPMAPAAAEPGEGAASAGLRTPPSWDGTDVGEAEPPRPRRPAVLALLGVLAFLLLTAAGLAVMLRAARTWMPAELTRGVISTPATPTTAPPPAVGDTVSQPGVPETYTVLPPVPRATQTDVAPAPPPAAAPASQAPPTAPALPTAPAPPTAPATLDALPPSADAPPPSNDAPPPPTDGPPPPATDGPINPPPPVPPPGV